MLRERGTLIIARGDLVLIKESGAALKVRAGGDTVKRDGDYVIIDGELTDDGLLQVVTIAQMMTDDELSQCAYFLHAKHGAKAMEHTKQRLDRAEKEGSIADIEIWRELASRVKKIRLLQGTPWSANAANSTRG